MEDCRRALGSLKGWLTAILTGLLCAGGLDGYFRPAAVWAEPPLDSTAAAKPAGSLLIPAYAFDRGHNVVTCTTRYADAGPMVGNVRYPSDIEYDIDFPVTAQYTLHIRYAAQAARPVQLLLDGENLGRCCRAATGGWNTSQAAWEQTCKLSITKGKHTVKLYRDGYLPHVVSLRFDSPVALPKGWKLHRPGARKLPPPPFSPARVNVAALRLAIADLTKVPPKPAGPVQRVKNLAQF